MGRANPFTPRGTHLWEIGGSAGARTGRHVSGWLLGRVPILGRTPRSSLCPPLLGPGGPSQQVSFLLLIRLSWITGTHLLPSQRPCPPTLGATGVAGHTSSGEGRRRRRVRGGPRYVFQLYYVT